MLFRSWTIIAYVDGEGWRLMDGRPRFRTQAGALIVAIQANRNPRTSIDWFPVRTDTKIPIYSAEADRPVWVNVLSLSAWGSIDR